jgi:hypothetical protein
MQKRTFSGIFSVDPFWKFLASLFSYYAVNLGTVRLYVLK